MSVEERLTRVETKQETIANTLDGHKEDSANNFKEIIDRMGKIEDQLSTWKTVLRVLRTLGAVLLLIATFKFGDIKTAIIGFFQ